MFFEENCEEKKTQKIEETNRERYISAMCEYHWKLEAEFKIKKKKVK